MTATTQASASGTTAQWAELVLPCSDLDRTVDFFGDLGFAVAEVLPADAPREVAVAGHGLRLRLSVDATGDPGTVRLAFHDPTAVASGQRELRAPNGTRVLLVPSDPPVTVPPLDPRFVLTRAPAADPGAGGRAGMLYRDLIPGRLGGRYIASHISVPDPGPVPDYVHFHRIRFQMIVCVRGWVRVVYEDQGEPFVLEAGDCVLQPPQIRHRVLEGSGGMEVVEISCPAEHVTRADPTVPLPNPRLDPDRLFDGQRFLRHRAALATWAPWLDPAFDSRDTGMTAATGGIAHTHVVRTGAPGAHNGWLRADDDLTFGFVTAGTVRLCRPGHADEDLARADSYVLPPGSSYALREPSPDFELLDVRVPA